jgi:hypothetical protein
MALLKFERGRIHEDESIVRAFTQMSGQNRRREL